MSACPIFLCNFKLQAAGKFRKMIAYNNKLRFLLFSQYLSFTNCDIIIFDKKYVYFMKKEKFFYEVIK